MEDKIFALESEKVERERVGEMEVEPQVQASQVQLESTPIDAAKTNRKRLQEIEGMGKSCKWKLGRLLASAISGDLGLKSFANPAELCFLNNLPSALDVFKRGLKYQIRKKVMVLHQQEYDYGDLEVRFDDQEFQICKKVMQITGWIEEELEFMTIVNATHLNEWVTLPSFAEFDRHHKEYDPYIDDRSTI
ncbi:hypothetical protein AXG93_3242s1090 [Marchantia polymorpha subsp. ruderalis]|uniref:Uncharacterized protein n=1 Tax=Marchantia polymorpha subsp. ruderalis TaxID=1480154 RepID=A0A176WH85_MARPO|nr:hypothetical protein AXG93_3242s1090 [Marchantia polymorpha subsp. ruderalis]